MYPTDSLLPSSSIYFHIFNNDNVIMVEMVIFTATCSGGGASPSSARRQREPQMVVDGGGLWWQHVAGPEEAAFQYDPERRGLLCFWINWRSSPQISTDLPGGLSSATPGLWHGTISKATSGLVVRLSITNVIQMFSMF